MEKKKMVKIGGGGGQNSNPKSGITIRISREIAAALLEDAEKSGKAVIRLEK